ncbi:response regulator transcription factor [Marinomonas sp. 5E14-1]|uniref:response regulator transcription factor n=1 Tax=Marinomonas sp. 5E14-1 TaxID=3153922 RepID=UPI003263C886
MKILCWNTDDAVWTHWNQIVSVNVDLFRVESREEVRRSLQGLSADFRYCFIYLADNGFAKHVEDVVALREEFPYQKIIVFPNQSSQAAALRLFSVGVSGQCNPYIGKEQLSLVLSVVDSGEIWGGKAFIQQLISQSAANAVSENELEGLSDRELDVTQLVARGLSNRDIANEMGITERTVKAHLTSIFKKTNTKDRLALALLAQN